MDELPLHAIKTRATRFSGVDIESRLRLLEVQCPHCKEMMLPLQVNGKGVFEIRFMNGQVHSINEAWLKDNPKVSEITNSSCK